MLPRSLFFLAFGTGTLAGPSCSRYQHVVYPCPGSAPSRSTIAWQPTPDHPPLLQVTVFGLSPLVPLTTAQVRIDSGSWVPLDTAGRAHIALASPSDSALVEVRALGYAFARTRVGISPDSGILAVAILEPRVLTIDEACGDGIGKVYARKPWWKFW